MDNLYIIIYILLGFDVFVCLLFSSAAIYLYVLSGNISRLVACQEADEVCVFHRASCSVHKSELARNGCLEIIESIGFREVTIEQSLMQTHAAVSLFSTVLNQAISNSVPVVIDDISNREHFEKLKELEYVCLNREHTLLSNIVGR